MTSKPLEPGEDVLGNERQKLEHGRILVAFRLVGLLYGLAVVVLSKLPWHNIQNYPF